MQHRSTPMFTPLNSRDCGHLYSLLVYYFLLDELFFYFPDKNPWMARKLCTVYISIICTSTCCIGMRLVRLSCFPSNKILTPWILLIETYTQKYHLITPLPCQMQFAKLCFPPYNSFAYFFSSFFLAWYIRFSMILLLLIPTS